jgi:sigma-B regulation protein RsbU (phosphoserine phosphatase)
MGDQYQAAVMRGLNASATEAGARLVCFVGGQVPGPATLPSGRHRVYELCCPRNVDGVVALSSTLLHDVGKAALSRYFERYRPLPLCSIGVGLSGIPSVTVDNEVGIRALIEHAIEEHGARRIAFVRGPLANAEAELRLTAYRDTLARHGMPFDERLIVTGTFSADSGVEAVRILSGLPDLKLADIDTILASNDAMAMGVLSALEQRGVSVPGQIRVLGFDDVQDARLTQPPLTTVRQPLERLGQEGLRLTLDWIRHGVVPASRELVTEPVIRRSCGCLLPSGKAGPSLGPERSLGFEAALLMKRERIIADLARASQGEFAAAGADWADRLLNALVADLRNPEPSSFVSAFDGLLERLLARGIDLNSCDDVLGALRARVVPLLRSDRARGERAEDLFHLCRVATSHAIQRSLMRERLHLGRWGQALNATCTALASSAGLDELMACTLELLPSLGIESCWVIVYGDADARVLVGYDPGGALPAAGVAVDASALAPARASSERSVSLAVLPLVFRGKNLGHVSFTLDLRHTYAYGAIARAMSVGVHGALGGSTAAPGPG